MSTFLSWRFIDLDEYIENKEHKSISEIFLEKSENGFREIENSCLKEICSINENIVVSCGGGTPCFFDNMSLINESEISIWINPKIDTLFSRLSRFKKTRPLVSFLNNEDLRKKITSDLENRKKFYSRADYILSF